jgi:hypothetical protein
VSATSHGSSAKSIGFTWAAKLSGVRTSSHGLGVHTLVGGTPVDFHWDQARHKYVRVIGGVAQRAAVRRP